MSAGRATTHRPNMWQRFAGKGGIGKARALCDCVAADHGFLSFEKDDEITVLLRIPDREDAYIGSCHGALGIFAGSNVEWLGPLKKPIKRIRVPTRMGNYTPSMQSSSYDSDASSGHFGRLPSADNTFSPTSPGWLIQHSPYLDERQRSLSASISAGSTTDVENSPLVLYEDYQRRRSIPLEDVLPHSTVRPWLSAVAESIHNNDLNPTMRGSSHSSTYGTIPEVSSDSSSLSPRATYTDPQQPSPSTLPGLGHDQTGYGLKQKLPSLRSGARQELASGSSSFPPPLSPLRPSYPASLHMPKPRIPTHHRPSFLKHSFTSTVTNENPLRGTGFGDSVLVEDDDDIPPVGGSAPIVASSSVFNASSFKNIISRSPRPPSARDQVLLGSPSPRSPLSPIFPNYPMTWSPSTVSVPLFSASPATSPAPHLAHRKSTMSPRNRLASLTKRPRPSSRSGSGSPSCADAENLPPQLPLPNAPARRRNLTASESAHRTSTSSPLLRETFRMGASPSPPKPFRSADTAIRLSLDTRPPSSGRTSSGSGGRHSVSSSSRGPMSARERLGGSPSESSDTAPDWNNLVYASTESVSETVPVPRRDEWMLPPLALRRTSRLGFESIPEEGENSMLAGDGHGFFKRSLVVNPLKYEFEQAALKRRKDVRVHSSSSSSSNRLSRSDGESSWPSN